MSHHIKRRAPWVLLGILAVAAFAACQFGLAPCSWGKPLGLTLALASAVTSFLDTPTFSRDT
jgi:hypothetical protein